MKAKNAGDPDADARAKQLRSRSDVHLSLLWSLLGTGAILYWDGFGLQWWQCFVALGVIAGAVHRSLWVGVFSFLGVAILWTILVWVLLLVTT